jgi:hypothetical protein
MTLVLLQSVVDIRTPEITFTLSVKIRTFFAAQNVIHVCKHFDVQIRKIIAQHNVITGIRTF